MAGHKQMLQNIILQGWIKDFGQGGEGFVKVEGQQPWREREARAYMGVWGYAPKAVVRVFILQKIFEIVYCCRWVLVHFGYQNVLIQA